MYRINYDMNFKANIYIFFTHIQRWNCSLIKKLQQFVENRNTTAKILFTLKGLGGGR